MGPGNLSFHEKRNTASEPASKTESNELGFSQFPHFCDQYCRKTETRLPDRVQSLRGHCTRVEAPVGFFKQPLVIFE